MKDTKYIRKRKRKYGTAFLVEIPYTDDSGHSVRFTETIRVIDYPSEKAALNAAQKVRNDALIGIQTGRLRQRIPTVRSIYEKRWTVLPLSIKSRERYDNTFRHVMSEYADISLADITLEQIQMSLNRHAELFPSDAVRRVMTLWKSLYKTAAILGYDIPDKTQGVTIPVSKVISQPRSVNISEDDLRIVFDAVLFYNAQDDFAHNSLMIWFMLQIMYHTGCRPAEALALTRSDVHEKHISINKSVGSTSSQKRQIIPTKTASSVRDVPIVPELRSVLDDLLTLSQGEYLLTDENGDLFEINYVSNLIRLATKKTGIHFTAYMLRHKMSTDLLHAGDAVVARDLLGHSSFGMTLDYARSTQDQLRSAIESRSAESQPKNNSHIPPQIAIKRHYQILRIIACLRIICVIKGISEH